MSMSAKHLKELETKIQDKLYENIRLLTHIYPTTRDFDAVFKRNMFAKSNKAAFQHVIHYLFNILNPELTKEKITTWPLYDVRLESVFRNEVVALVNHINCEYEHANIPNLMASHLVSPGGFKFGKFMLKLSMLVIYEHLKKNDEIEAELLSSIRPHKDPNITNIVTKNLVVNLGLVETNTEEKWEKFHTKFEEAKLEAGKIVVEQTQIEKDLCDTNRRLEEKKKNQNDKNVNDLKEKYNSLNEKMMDLEKNKDFCVRGKELLTFLSSDKPVLNFKKEDLFIPNSVKHLLNVDNELNLHSLFNSLSILLENESLEMPVLTTNQLNDVTKFLTDLNEKYSHLDQKLTLHKNELIEMSENFSSKTENTPKMKKAPVLVLTTPKGDVCNL